MRDARLLGEKGEAGSVRLSCREGGREGGGREGGRDILQMDAILNVELCCVAGPGSGARERAVRVAQRASPGARLQDLWRVLSRCVPAALRSSHGPSIPPSMSCCCLCPGLCGHLTSTHPRRQDGASVDRTGAHDVRSDSESCALHLHAQYLLAQTCCALLQDLPRDFKLIEVPGSPCMALRHPPSCPDLVLLPESCPASMRPPEQNLACLLL
jgi:hypothetical protein